MKGLIIVYWIWMGWWIFCYNFWYCLIVLFVNGVRNLFFLIIFCGSNNKGLFLMFEINLLGLIFGIIGELVWVIIDICCVIWGC